MLIQKIFRVYPEGWTGNSRGQLNDILSQGWTVKLITDMGKGVHDYLIEKDDTKNFLINKPSITDDELTSAITFYTFLNLTYGVNTEELGKHRDTVLKALKAISRFNQT